MITDGDRAILIELVNAGVWKIRVNMRLIDVAVTDETRALFGRMLHRQEPDTRHHAPCCNANHYHNSRLVLHPCTCGAVEEEGRRDGRNAAYEERRAKELSDEEKWIDPSFSDVLHMKDKPGLTERILGMRETYEEVSGRVLRP